MQGLRVAPPPPGHDGTVPSDVGRSTFFYESALMRKKLQKLKAI
jgi:hypothetical protein